MLFNKSSSPDAVVDYLTGVLRAKLADGQAVLWLVSGGSAIGVAVAVAKNLQSVELNKLTVTLADERFGPMGHADSNWQQLTAAGFALPGARLVPVLHGHDIDQTTSEFATHLQEYCKGSAYCVALLGIGPDGHTAGILPNSPAVTATEWAVHYQGPDYNRVTMTPPAIAALNEVVVYAMGEAKHQPLDNLQTDLPPAQQPAQVLKKVTKVTIFNDYIGEDA